MQLRDQESELSSPENISNLANLAEENLDSQATSEPINFPVAAQVEPSASSPKKKFIKLGLLIGLPLSFLVGLGAVLVFLPEALSCGNKARESAARNNIGAIGRGQQAYFLENNKFAGSISELAIGIPPQTNDYQYFAQADRQFVVTYAQSKKSNFKSYLGVVFIETLPHSDGATMPRSILCEVNQSQPLASIMPVYQNGLVSCPKGTKLLGY